ncbi:SDR family oxidoreductase [Bacteroides sp.]|uniref:SDR family NAD(P)-dependent oxidoreductase n=1 Tax=Bacteroides sp. TaxID=29523 RepID=UPI00262EAD1C|nr:SDR family oxidoreductase [Bacteroides sp.]
MNYNPYNLNGKKILITGASSGIGRATAIECSKMGAKCIITARNSERLQETFDKLEGDGHMLIIADLTKADDIVKIIQQIPVLDGFVNNAGIALTKLINFINIDDLNNMFAVNTFAPVLLTKELIKKKKINKGASIVVTSSLASKVQTYGNSVYGMTKSAMETFTRYCALEVAGKKIRVNSVHPGMVNTEMVSNLILSEDELLQDLNKYPLKRYGNAKEIAWSIIYLLSDASLWITGTSLVIDGGFHLV